MRKVAGNISIKFQLCAVLAMLALALIAGIGSGWYATRKAEAGFETLYNDRVIPLRNLKAIADMFAVNIVDTSHKMRNGHLKAPDAIDAITKAQDRIDRDWSAYLKTRLDDDERQSTSELKPQIDKAKDLSHRLVDALRREDRTALDQLIDSELYQIIDPVSEGIAELVEHQLRVSADIKSSFERDAKAVSIVFGIVAIAAAIAGAIALLATFGGVLRPLKRITGAMLQLSKNDLSVEIAGRDNRNEIGDMARALDVFKANAIEMRRLEAEQKEMERRAADEKRRAMNELADGFERSVGGIVELVSSAATELQTTATAMTATAEETSRQATTVAAASEQASANVQMVAGAAEELTASVKEIGGQVTESAKVTEQAVTKIEHANVSVKGLTEAAQRIGKVIDLINDVASQTSLLALNATIEAARAGAAGKGFAVVASEVKALATQTAKATEEIGDQITTMQGATTDVVSMVDGIGHVISRIDEIAVTISSAVEEQEAATQEIARNIQQAAIGTQDVSVNITSVTQAAGDTGASALQVLNASRDLAQQGALLRGEVSKFLAVVRAA